jgi:hypothetical protein
VPIGEELRGRMQSITTLDIHNDDDDEDDFLFLFLPSLHSFLVFFVVAVFRFFFVLLLTSFIFLSFLVSFLHFAPI